MMTELKQLQKRSAEYQRCIAAGDDRTIALQKDGTVFVTQKSFNDGVIKGIPVYATAVYAAYEHIAWIEDDGVAVINKKRFDEDELWRDITALALGLDHFIALKADRTVVASGENDKGQCDIGDWRDIAAVAAGSGFTIGLKTDGTVIAAGDNGHNQCDVSGWKNIAAVCASCFHTIGLKEDGTVVAAGSNEWGQCNVGDWQDIIAVSTNEMHTVGLKADGTLVMAWTKDYDNHYRWKEIVESWHDVLAVAAGRLHIVHLNANEFRPVQGAGGSGQIGKFTQLDTDDWRNIGPYVKGLRQEWEEAKRLAEEKAEQEARLAEEKAQQEEARQRAEALRSQKQWRIDNKAFIDEHLNHFPGFRAIYDKLCSLEERLPELMLGEGKDAETLYYLAEYITEWRKESFIPHDYFDFLPIIGEVKYISETTDIRLLSTFRWQWSASGYHWTRLYQTGLSEVKTRWDQLESYVTDLGHCDHGVYYFEPEDQSYNLKLTNGGILRFPGCEEMLRHLICRIRECAGKL